MGNDFGEGRKDSDHSYHKAYVGKVGRSPSTHDAGRTTSDYPKDRMTHVSPNPVGENPADLNSEYRYSKKGVHSGVEIRPESGVSADPDCDGSSGRMPGSAGDLNRATPRQTTQHRNNPFHQGTNRSG